MHEKTSQVRGQGRDLARWNVAEITRRMVYKQVSFCTVLMQVVSLLPWLFDACSDRFNHLRLMRGKKPLTNQTDWLLLKAGSDTDTGSNIVRTSFKTVINFFYTWITATDGQTDVVFNYQYCHKRLLHVNQPQTDMHCVQHSVYVFYTWITDRQTDRHWVRMIYIM